MTRIHWMNWRVVVALAVVAGFALAHVVDWCSRNGRAALERLANRKAWSDLRARGLVCIREVSTRQGRRRQQREWVRANGAQAAAMPEGRVLTRRRRREALHAELQRIRRVAKQQSAQR